MNYLCIVCRSANIQVGQMYKDLRKQMYNPGFLIPRSAKKNQYVGYL